MGLLDHVATQFFKDPPYSFNRLTGFDMHGLSDTFFNHHESNSPKDVIGGSRCRGYIDLFI